jgi:hypothetical protein
MVFASDYLRASLIYKDKKVFFTKGTTVIDSTLLVDFGVNEYEGGYYLTLKFKNPGNENSEVITRPLTLDTAFTSDSFFT